MADADNSVSSREPVVDRSGLGIEAERARRYEAQLSIILINVDGLSLVNKDMGREGGDYLLSELAQLIRDNIRKIDIFGRWSTDDFVILTVDRNLYGSVALAHKLKRLISRKTFTFHGKSMKITVSMGVARGTPSKAEQVDELIIEAQKALLKAKAAGRNRVEFTGDRSLSTPVQMPAVKRKDEL